MATKRSSVYVDAQGRTRQCILTGNATLASVEAALIAVSNADVHDSWEGADVINGAPAPTAAIYEGVADYVPLTYSDASGNLVYITLVAPQSGIFLPDGETVNPAAIAALSAAIIGTVLTGAGLPATTFIGGTRRRSMREYQ